jgi:hypothetical protein
MIDQMAEHERIQQITETGMQMSKTFKFFSSLMSREDGCLYRNKVEFATNHAQLMPLAFFNIQSPILLFLGSSQCLLIAFLAQHLKNFFFNFFSKLKMFN